MGQELTPTPTAADCARLSLSPATLRAYRTDWADFTTWCQGKGVSPLPADPTTVADYLASLALTHGRSALKRRLSAIGQAHRLGHDPTPLLLPSINGSRVGPAPCSAP